MAATPPARLLVVDDEVSLMVDLRDTLREEGYQVTGVRSGAEALAILRQTGFDLVLTDLIMPKMDGIALLRDAWAIDPNVVGIVMTGQGSILTAVDAMKSGAIDYVLKPIKLSALLPALDRALTMQRLRAQNAELEKRVRERTAELEVANRDLEAFCSSVSHDLRTPLRTISGFAELSLEFRESALPPEVRRYLGFIRAGADEMAQLISGLLAFSRFGRQALAPEAVDLELLGRAVFQELEPERCGRRVDLHVQALPPVYGDPVLLRQVLINLLSNALKYTRPRERATVELGVMVQVGEATPVYFVRDNGVGFDMRHAEKLFGVFQRLHHAREFEGTGVGLATVQRIIERHGGRIWTEAALDSGATFYFTLPLAPAIPAAVPSG